MAEPLVCIQLVPVMRNCKYALKLWCIILAKCLAFDLSESWKSRYNLWILQCVIPVVCPLLWQARTAGSKVGCFRALLSILISLVWHYVRTLFSCTLFMYTVNYYCVIKCLARDHQDWIGLCSVLRPRQHSIGYMGDGFYRSKDPTNSIKVLKVHIVHRPPGSNVTVI